MSLILWRRGCRDALLSTVKAEAEHLPPYQPGRSDGENWPLPPLSEETAPLFLAEAALPMLISVYEEYIDRYLVAKDFDCPPRRWLHDNVQAGPGVLEFVFPLLEGPLAEHAVEVLLVRLVWLIQRCPGLVPYTSATEAVVTTSVGIIGVRDGTVLYRFIPQGVPLSHKALISRHLALGHIRVFTSALNRLYAKLSEEGRRALTLLAVRSGSNKKLLRQLYDDGLVTGSYLSSFHSVNDRLMSIEQAVQRSAYPAETLQQILVPEYLAPEEYRTLFRIPWARHRRERVTSQYLISKMPLVRQVLNQA